MKLLLLVLVSLLLVLQYRLWFGRGNLLEVEEFRQQKQAQMVENARLQERNQALAAEVLDLKQGMQAIEEKARIEMGMIRSNETFYQIVDEAGAGHGKED